MPPLIPRLVRGAAARTEHRADEPALRVRGLTHHFGALTVLDDFGLRIERGERVGLTGANGSGKTTLLRCVAGTLTPAAGTLTVAGHPAGSIAARRVVGIALGHERALYPRLSAAQNLAFAAALRMPRERVAVAVAEIEDEFGITPFAQRRIERCSTGMRARVAAARALLGEPALVLLDEPARSLDEAATAAVWSALGNRPGLALLVASPRAAELRSCDRVIDLGSRR